jgi:FkbM family methyltransferase
MIRTLARRLPRPIKNRVKGYIKSLVPPEEATESFERSLSRLGPDLKMVFDVGANVGDMTMSMCKWFPDATVHAFEPYSKTFEILRTRVEASPYRDRVRLHNLGFYDKKGTAPLHVTSFHGANSLVAVSPAYHVFNPHIREEGSEDVQLVRLDDFVAEAGITQIDLMKVDVEGAEFEVFAGGVSTLSSMIDTILCEMSFARFPRERGEYIRVFQMLQDCGFAPAEIYDVAQGDTGDQWRLAQFDCVFRSFRAASRTDSNVGHASASSGGMV